ncbi:hypothetical protein RND81_11G152200 [Saponaria officinalis]|uniref:Phosphatidylinositol-specific phospholipase C X domain-containing protein n=1 Tax=Saponaria officinalis TaxID=3572 RepID=A0AAW1HP19_SAPOF
MGNLASALIDQPILREAERGSLADLQQRCGSDYPGCEYRPSDRKTWMASLGPRRLAINQIVWPGTHNSASNGVGYFFSRCFAECQTLSIYDQLVKGVRLLDVRVQQNGRVCHGLIEGYHVDVVLQDVKRFLSETVSEIIILEIRTEFGENDPPEFDKYLVEGLGDYLIPQDDKVFGKTVGKVLPKRVICIWKPRNSAAPEAGSQLWSARYLKDDWINTNFPLTKFQGNLSHLGEQPPASSRKFLNRVENTLTPQSDSPNLLVKELAGWINGYARLFIAQCFSKGIANRLQVLSTDFVDDDFVDACVGLTYARVEWNVHGYLYYFYRLFV